MYCPAVARIDCYYSEMRFSNQDRVFITLATHFYWSKFNWVPPNFYGTRMIWWEPREFFQ